MSDNKPTSLRESTIKVFMALGYKLSEQPGLQPVFKKSRAAKSPIDHFINFVIPIEDAEEIAAYYEGLIPEKRKLYEPVTQREVKEDETVTIDLLMDKKGSLVFIQDNGFNLAIHNFHRNFTGQTDNERKDSRI